MSEDEICEYVGATSLHFLSYNGMIKATGLPASRFSTSCFNGVYPIPVGRSARGIALLNTMQPKPKSLAQLAILPNTIST
jgi:glutamine phosphoribosylpyrophosphate amidotransferase